MMIVSLRRMGRVVVYDRYRQDTGDDIISKKSLLVVKEIINFLKEHAREEGLFRRSGRRKFRRRILNCLNKGEKPSQLDLGDDVALECAAALQLFLTRLKKPVIPKHIQELILADNPGVTAGVVARDALGLIRQDISGRHSELLADLLNLIRYLTLSGPPSERTELQGSPLPITLLPVFFALKPSDLLKWKQVAARFKELITEAPKQLRINDNRRFESTTISRTNENNQNEIQQETQLEESTRLNELPVLCPFIRFTDNYNRFNAGEMTNTLATAPLHWPTADRLHPLISHTNRQIRSNV